MEVPGESGKRRSRDGRPAKAFSTEPCSSWDTYRQMAEWVSERPGSRRAAARLSTGGRRHDEKRQHSDQRDGGWRNPARSRRSAFREQTGRPDFRIRAPRGGGAGPAMAAARPSRSPPRECLHQEASLPGAAISSWAMRSEEHTSELQSLRHLVCRLLLEKKKINI